MGESLEKDFLNRAHQYETSFTYKISKHVSACFQTNNFSFHKIVITGSTNEAILF